MEREGQGLRSTDKIANSFEPFLNLQAQILVWHPGVCISM